ncbi:hypothetical protein CCHR01_06633 [Colletotrichum chrysophilum]|uniref:Uncharacterized protein n=1 Tax=Colletotrichum chrysophilum TaxID=1836956 RepID=A0AAD9APF0_9PEZI|nr:hypothetical protein CCHR01_06633 [Colletotrichum chrysophilum]
MTVQDAATTQRSPQTDQIASLRIKDAPLAELPTPQRKTFGETETFLQNRVAGDSHDSGHEPNTTALSRSDVGSHTKRRLNSRLWVKPPKDSGTPVPLVTKYEPASEQSLITRSAVNRLGLRVLPNKPTGRTIKTTWGILECQAFVSITVESPLTGDSRPETFNIAIAEDWLIAAQGVELLAGRRIIEKLEELGVSNPAAISDGRPTISETSASSITERNGPESLYYSCKDVQHQRATGLSGNPFDRDDSSLGSSEASTHLTEGSERKDPLNWNDCSSVSWSNESDRKTSAKSETLSEFGRTFKLRDDKSGEHGSGSYNGNGPVHDSLSRGLEKGKRLDWANLNTARAVSSEASNDDDHLGPAPAGKMKSQGNLPSDTLPRTPQCFQATKGSHLERVWSIRTREQISAMTVLTYTLLVFMPSLAFCFVYWFEITKYTHVWK